MNELEQINYLIKKRIVIPVMNETKFSYDEGLPCNSNPFEKIELANLFEYLKNEIRKRDADISKLQSELITYWRMSI